MYLSRKKLSLLHAWPPSRLRNLLEREKASNQKAGLRGGHAGDRVASPIALTPEPHSHDRARQGVQFEDSSFLPVPSSLDGRAGKGGSAASAGVNHGGGGAGGGGGAAREDDVSEEDGRLGVRGVCVRGREKERALSTEGESAGHARSHSPSLVRFFSKNWIRTVVRTCSQTRLRRREIHVNSQDTGRS